MSRLTPPTRSRRQRLLERLVWGLHSGVGMRRILFLTLLPIACGPALPEGDGEGGGTGSASASGAETTETSGMPEASTGDESGAEGCAEDASFFVPGCTEGWSGDYAELPNEGCYQRCWESVQVCDDGEVCLPTVVDPCPYGSEDCGSTCGAEEWLCLRVPAPELEFEATGACLIGGLAIHATSSDLQFGLLLQIGAELFDPKASGPSSWELELPQDSAFVMAHQVLGIGHQLEYCSDYFVPTEVLRRYEATGGQVFVTFDPDVECEACDGSAVANLTNITLEAEGVPPLVLESYELETLVTPASGG